MNFTNLTTRILFSDKDLFLNMEKFQRKKGMNMLFVTGTSGSGKSTLSYDLATQYNAEPIELDGFDDLGTMKDDHPFIHEYFGLNPHLTKQNHLTTKDFRDAFSWLVKRCSEYPDRLYVINGLQIYQDLENRSKWLAGKPLVIKGTSLTSTIFRKVKRGDYKILKTGDILLSIKYSIENHQYANEFTSKMTAK